MDNLNLLLKFKMTGDAELHVRGAARICVDGLGGLLVYDSATGKPERISLSELSAICIDRPAAADASGPWIN